MKTVQVVLVLSLALVCGCARHYVVRTTNGTQLIAASKPKLQNGYYVYKDASGKPFYIAQGRVAEIAPAARAAKEKPMFKPTPEH